MLLPRRYHKQASALLLASKQNEIACKPPKIIYKWTRNTSIDEKIVHAFKSMNIFCEFGLGNVIGDIEYLPLTKTVNLDTTTLIAMVSDLVHRFEDIPKTAFENSHLKEQENNERLTPLLPVLIKLLKDRSLITTKQAYEKFMEIITFIGGQTESKRASDIFDKNSDSLWKVKIVNNEPSEAFLNLQLKGRLKKHHVNIFGTADKLKCTTVTANGFLRCFEDAGLVNLSVFSIEPRSLIEQRWEKMVHQTK